MCLELRPKLSKTPYNRSTIRWKLVNLGTVSINAVFQGMRYKRDAVNHAKLTSNRWSWNTDRYIMKKLTDNEAGFHVLLAKTHHHGCDLMKVRVSGFLRSGTWWHHKCETWKRMKVLDIYVRGKRFNKTGRRWKALAKSGL